MKAKRLRYLILAADLIWMPVALYLSYTVRHGVAHTHTFWLTYLQFILVASALWVGLFSAMKLDGFRMGWYMPAVASQLILGIGTLILLLLAIDDLARFYVSRLLLGYFGALLFAGCVCIRRGVHAFLRSRYLEWAVRRVIVVGSGPVAREIAAKFGRHPELLCQVVGFLCSEDAGLDLHPQGPSEGYLNISTLGIIDLLRNRGVDEVIVALPSMDSGVMNLAARCRIQGIRVSVVPHPYELYLSKPELVDVGGLPVLQLHQANAAFADSIWKRGLDVVFGLILAVLTLPLVLAGILVLRKRPGGGMSFERRCGRLGETFSMLRLNSERDRAGISRWESMLQRLSITELPQLWNVLRGDMSLVGPRPESPERVKHYSDWQRQRLNVKPGMTGMAQVHGLREQNSSEEKTRYDLQYMLNSSPFLDLSLMMQTAWTLIMRFIRLPGAPRQQTDNQTDPVLNRVFEGTIPNAHRAQSSTN